MMLLSLLLVVLAIFGAPLFAVIAASALIGYQKEGIDLMALAIEVLGIAGMPILSAIPLFTFAGYLLSESNAPQRLVRLTGAILGWLPGGLALVALAACAFFTAFTGASGVTIIALGAILYPALQQDGYPDKFNLGLVTTSGSLGLLFAPSLPLILYGVVSEVSIDGLFRAGLLPGLLMLVMLSVYSLWVNRITDREPILARGFPGNRDGVWSLSVERPGQPQTTQEPQPRGPSSDWHGEFHQGTRMT
jgi:tripartite ATP-independent transporter DctM subunit